jgi:cyclophilin family peptidyl-prolyl cis-trans isomerase
MRKTWLGWWNPNSRRRRTKARSAATAARRYRPRLDCLEARLVPSDFLGGVHVAGGDLDGDGLAEVVTGADQGGGPNVKVFSGATGALVNSFMAYDPVFTGGVNVAVGRVTGSSTADIITGAGPGGGPHVKVFDLTGNLLRSFFAYDPGLTSGVNVAAGDVNGDGIDDIITAPATNAPANVKVFDGATGNLISSFFAYDAVFTGGASVAAADVNGDGRAEIVTGAGEGGGPHVKVFNGLTGEVLNSFFAYDAGFTGGVRVAAGAGNTPEILTAAGPGGGPHLKVFDANSTALVNSLMAYDPSFRGGVSVANLGIGDGGGNAIVTGAGAGGPSQVQVYNSSAQTPYSTFAAFDPAKAPSGGFNATVTNDRVPPTVTISSPPPGQVVSQNITVQGTVSDDNSGVRTLEAQVDGGAFSSVSFDASGNFSLTTNLPVDGSATGAHTVTFRARDKGGNTGTASVGFTLDLAPVVSTPIADVSVSAGAAPTVINLLDNFTDPDSATQTIAHFDTNLGPIDVQLFDTQTPLTVKNFLTYVTSGSYQDTIFHRSVTNFVVQAGGFTFDEANSDVVDVTTDAPVKNEPGISNTRGTIAMAKLGNDPNSATSQFFFNLSDSNASNLDNQNGGFTVFGKVLGDGMKVVDAIAALPIKDESSFNAALNEIPLNNYNGSNFPFDATKSNFALINTITTSKTGGQLTFSVVNNTNAGLVTPTVDGGNLTLTYAAGQKGTATITVQATDQFGLSVQTTFTVTVS